MKNIKEIKKQEIIKGNPLIEAKHDHMNVTEYKLILTAISKIDKYTKTLIEPIRFKVDEFCKIMEITKNSAFSNIKKNCEQLRKRGISIKLEDKWETHNWIKSIEYEKSIITIWLNDRLCDYILFCKKNKVYTKYLLNIILKFNSFYTIRLYELLKQYQKIGIRKFSIEELKILLGIPTTKYRQYKNLKLRVLTPILKEINTLSDIIIDFKEVKQSRRINEIIFNFKDNLITKNYITNYDDMAKEKLFILLKKIYSDKTGFIIQFSHISNYHRIIIIELIKRFELGYYDETNIRSPIGFLKWVLDDIENNYDLTNKKDY